MFFSIVFQRSEQGAEGVAVTRVTGWRGASILLSLMYSFGFTFFVGGLFKLGQDLLTFVNPQILRLAAGSGTCRKVMLTMFIHNKHIILSLEFGWPNV